MNKNGVRKEKAGRKELLCVMIFSQGSIYFTCQGSVFKGL